MKSSSKRPRNPETLLLGDLIVAVTDASRNNQEAVAAVADLLDRGRVRLVSNGRKVRARLV